jgi:ARG and Rhodanese-Phosphatase-superfamily-associated Protein domain
MTDPVVGLLNRVSLGDAVVFQNLTMFPLVCPRQERRPELEYVVLDDGLAAGAVEITEVSEEGSVPELRVVNRGPTPVLIADGEELLGAKQNRVVNLTILVPAAAELTIPVSCVEAGRWRTRSSSFTAAPRTQYAAGRAKRMYQVTRALADRGDRVSDQAEVWADIALKSARMSALSPTSAMGQIFVEHATTLEEYVAGFPPVEGQCGAVFAIGERIAGVDLFDRPDSWRKLVPKLVRSYAVDALDYGLGVEVEPPSAPGPRLVSTFLAAVAGASCRTTGAVGMGEDVRLSANGIVGAALVVDDRVVHLSGFAT